MPILQKKGNEELLGGAGHASSRYSIAGYPFAYLSLCAVPLHQAPSRASRLRAFLSILPQGLKCWLEPLEGLKPSFWPLPVEARILYCCAVPSFLREREASSGGPREPSEGSPAIPQRAREPPHSIFLDFGTLGISFITT